MAVCSQPQAVVVLCGKRKSGKDFIAEKLIHMLAYQIIIGLVVGLQ